MALPDDWGSLSPTQQLFVGTNLERTARGLPPLSAMASELDFVSQIAANQDTDPLPPSGFPWTSFGGNWDAALGNPLESVYNWMYDDGEGSSNVDCTPTYTSGCWGHRDTILMPLRCAPCEMGAGFAAGAWLGLPSWSEILVDTSGAPGIDFSWAQVLPYLPDDGLASSDPDLFEFVSDHANGHVWNAYDQSANSGGPGVIGGTSTVVTPYDGLVHVFERSADNHLVEYVDDDIGGNLWNYYDLTAAFGGLDIVGNPSAVVDSNGVIHVVERASDGHLVEFADDGVGGNPWNAYDLTAAYAPSYPLAGDPAAVYDSARGTVEVYAEAFDGHLLELADDGVNGNAWNAYDLSAYAGGGSPINGTPGPVYDYSQGLVHIYVESWDYHLVEYVEDGANGLAWNAYDLSADAAGGFAVGDSPDAVYDPVQSLIHIYVEGANQDLIEYVSDHRSGSVWSAYNLSAVAGGGNAIAGVPAALFDWVQGEIHIYAEALNGDLLECIADHVGGRVWNCYDVTASSGGPELEGSPSAVMVGNLIHVYVGGL